jgi:hypothetical protein
MYTYIRHYMLEPKNKNIHYICKLSMHAYTILICNLAIFEYKKDRGVFFVDLHDHVSLHVKFPCTSSFIGVSHIVKKRFELLMSCTL